MTHRLLSALRTAPLGVQLSLALLVLLCLLALFAPLVSPHGETEIVGASYETGSAQFLLGTDNLGRDILSRLIYGTRNTLGIAMLATLLAFAVGAGAGILSATAGGAIDQLIGRVVDALIAIPQLILALLVLAIVGTSVVTLIGVIALVDATRVYRVARAATLNVVTLEYVESARIRGERPGWILLGEIFPNIAMPLFTEFGVRFSSVFLFISSLSFLGLGIQPPYADWGSMVREYASLLTFGEITPFIPAVAIAALAIAVNVIVDWALAANAQRPES